MAARLTLADNSKAAEASNTLCIDPTMHLRRGYQNFLPRDSAYERKPRIAIESARTLMDNLGGLFRSEPAFLARVLHPLEGGRRFPGLQQTREIERSVR